MPVTLLSQGIEEKKTLLCSVITHTNFFFFFGGEILQFGELLFLNY
jgi:hypothetical protein